MHKRPEKFEKKIENHRALPNDHVILEHAIISDFNYKIMLLNVILVMGT